MEQNAWKCSTRPAAAGTSARTGFGRQIAIGVEQDAKNTGVEQWIVRHLILLLESDQEGKPPPEAWIKLGEGVSCFIHCKPRSDHGEVPPITVHPLKRSAVGVWPDYPNAILAGTGSLCFIATWLLAGAHTDPLLNRHSDRTKPLAAALISHGGRVIASAWSLVGRADVYEDPSFANVKWIYNDATNSTVLLSRSDDPALFEAQAAARVSAIGWSHRRKH